MNEMGNWFFWLMVFLVAGLYNFFEASITIKINGEDAPWAVRALVAFACAVTTFHLGVIVFVRIYAWWMEPIW